MIHEVTCAIIQKDDKILICQRSKQMKLPLKWEFPGGKVEPSESYEDCLLREIFEELAIRVSVLRRLTVVEHHYAGFSIRLHPFVCQYEDGELLAAEHAQTVWVPKEKLMDYDWAEADIPVVRELIVATDAYW
ncbi:(deoxy)nucleoside triphosphate pyrophosphohydrolase [Olivibacter sitiensis]|uniref:(deoxy)nucleoside triphosphate pyrophosphohydrolase n=1 Tax=Olivibacter sitiensis TaxID=376470 RepID=UPI0004183451|nr:(deoxy)nucleoside triphosphate pyrophosphohydrolase [Olivibacter sitiensis]